MTCVWGQRRRWIGDRGSDNDSSVTELTQRLEELKIDSTESNTNYSVLRIHSFFQRKGMNTFCLNLNIIFKSCMAPNRMPKMSLEYAMDNYVLIKVGSFVLVS